jgi:hypothetical protein
MSMIYLFGVGCFIAGFALGGWVENRMRRQAEELWIKYGPRAPGPRF